MDNDEFALSKLSTKNIFGIVRRNKRTNYKPKNISESTRRRSLSTEDKSLKDQHLWQ